MVDQTRSGAAEVGDFVRFYTTGERAKGEYRCSVCGYGVAVWKELPRCPMCGGETWEQSDWSPFSRAGGEFL